MICPYCFHNETKVIDKRDVGSSTKRRRECLKCQKRFNTQENLERVEIRVVKKDGKVEAFDREKIKKGILRACEKRPITADKIDKIMIIIEEKLKKMGKEVKSSVIGEMVSKELKKLDKVAYIRFASVYRDFTDLDDFKNEIKELVRK
ncbi:MAG: transcriptional regulator NrdR [Nanoarchaeota archaeon]|nr:transcriptional regulator NrdR [Nanoarchaeota archaeon]